MNKNKYPSQHPILSNDPTDFETPLAVEMRRLYTKLRPRLRREDLNALLITSAERGEGKSTTSSNLAVTIARHKRTETVLIDADMRRPTIHKILGCTRGPGLSDLLMGKASVDGVLRGTPHEHLWVITAGSPVDHPGSLLETQAVSRLVEELRERYDMVIFDAPPVLPVADATMLIPEVDGVLMVVMAGLTPREVVRRAQAVLVDGRANMLGLVLNNAGEVLPYYYDYNYYSQE